jgi:protein TonB
MVSPNAVAQPPAWRRHALRALIVLVAGGLIVALALWLQTLSGVPSAPKRQVARIALLPDQPPPPPPPPKDEPPPPPREAPKQPLREEQVKEAEAPKPANEPIKMEGEAGSGPSAFAAGPVRSEYSGGAPQIGPAASAAAPRDRARERLYVNSARQMLRDTLERHFRSEIDEATAEFQLWLQRDGAIERVRLAPTGDGRLDRELQAALDRTSQELRLPPPPAPLGGGEPLRFRLTVKPTAG